MTHETDVLKRAAYIQELLAGETPDNAKRNARSMTSPHKTKDDLPPLLTQEEVSQAQEALINLYSI